MQPLNPLSNPTPPSFLEGKFSDNQASGRHTAALSEHTTCCLLHRYFDIIQEHSCHTAKGDRLSWQIVVEMEMPPPAAAQPISVRSLIMLIRNYTIVSAASLTSFYFVKEACLSSCLSLRLPDNYLVKVAQPVPAELPTTFENVGSVHSCVSLICKIHHFWALRGLSGTVPHTGDRNKPDLSIIIS